MLLQEEKMKKVIITLFVLILISYQSIPAQIPDPAGRWKFDDASDLTKPETGTALELIGTHTNAEGPTAGNGAVNIGTGSYYKVTHGIMPNGGGMRVNEYSLQIDFKIPAAGSWFTFFQTSSANNDDGECFINTSGNIGLQATGYSTYAVSANEWYRLVISVKNGFYYRYYLDGQPLLDGKMQTTDSRFSLENILLLFGDNDGDDGEIIIAEAAIWASPLSASQVQSLGGYNHQLPADALQPAGLWKFDNNTNLTEAYYGKDLVLTGSSQQVDGPSENNKAVRIGTGSYYQTETGIAPNGGGNFVNEYTLKFDFKVADIGNWRAFFQTSPSNTNDADCFINPSGNIGTTATGYSAYSVLPNEWYRLIISVKNGDFYRYYIDGQLLLEGNKQDIDGRFSLENTILFFADNDGEDTEVDIAEVSIWNRALSETDVQSFGGYGHILIDTTANTPKLVGNWKFDDANNLLKAEPNLGTPLELIGTHDIVDGPASGNEAVKIGPGSYYKMTHGIPANGGGILVNEYSIQIDFKIPEAGPWYTFFQTNPANSDDGELFVNPSGNIGVAAIGYSTSQIKNNEWYRLIVSVKNGTQYKYYLDGQLVHNGTAQVIDDRFALKNFLLMFADNDGEDSEIYCAELKIWNYSLSEQEIKAIGGFGHQAGIKQLVLVPYLETPTPTSIYVSWHDTASTFTKVNYGLTEALGQSAEGTSEVISDPYRWHTVKITGLKPNTNYFYRVVSGTGESSIHKFKTLPDSSFTGKIRILQFSDTHSGDSTMAVKVIKAAKEKAEQLYGADIQNQINLILHSGDLTVNGSIVNQFTDQFFSPFRSLSPYIPIMTTTGNHEGESINYYNYFHYDDFSLLPAPSLQNEKMWSFVLGNTAIISLNTNIVRTSGVVQKVMVENKLKEYESNPNIDFVFIIQHHMPFTELWVEALTYDGGPKWVKNELIPILKKYSKVQQITYGHTHAFERGTIESDKDKGDFRIVCAGGGGGETDNWGEFTNFDYPQIHISFDHYHFQIVEIDVQQQSFEASMYSLGNADKPLNSLLMDRWYRKLNQSGPEKPIAANPVTNENNIIFSSSVFAGSDSLMSSRLQISDNVNFVTIVIDTIFNWTNIYGADANFNPIDKNKGIDLSKLTLSKTLLDSGKQYYYRVKYRDHNLRWSVWSDYIPFDLTTSVSDNSTPDAYSLQQNFPNPFNPSTKIRYELPEAGPVSLRVYNILGKEAAILVDEYKQPGRYEINFNAGNLSSGVYYYKLKAGQFVSTKKLILIK